MSRLVVVVPAIQGRLTRWETLLTPLKAEAALEGSTWLLWDHFKGYGSVIDARSLARDLRARIDQEWISKGPFDDVILAGHSLGGLLVRQAYVMAQGGDVTTRQRSDWADRVSRIILLAGANRGVDPQRNLGMRFVAWSARAFTPLEKLLPCQLLRGSAFITNLRIQWIDLFARLGKKAPVVVQLLGTLDRIVTRDDSIDVGQFPNGYYVDVPDASHDDLYRVDKAPDPKGRYALLRDAFIHSKPKMGTQHSVRGAAHVVFVLHGIRANNRTWVEETINKMKLRSSAVEAIGPGYKYFSALRFAIPMFRRRNLAWFQDAYSEALARNPGAKFSFIGHSNGTYLFGESLRKIPGMRFERAVLIGSVLPAEYDWREVFQRQQLRELRVDGSSHDWPVAWLCKGLRSLGMRDIGTGGYDGFVNMAGPEKKEFLWYHGDHSAPLDASNLDALAEYALTGTIVPPKQLRADAKWFSIVSRAIGLMSPIVAVPAVLAVLWIGWLAPPAVVLALIATAALGVIVLDVI
jgi:pimeloyl-ACP methyl ester carboxylesterase